MNATQIEVRTAELRHLAPAEIGGSGKHEKRTLSDAERLKLLGFTLPETVQQGCSSLRPHLQFAALALRKHGYTDEYESMYRIIALIDRNSLAVTRMTRMISGGYFEDNPRRGLNIILRANPTLIWRAEHVRDCINHSLFPDENLDGILQIVPHVLTIRDISTESHNQLVYLDEILASPPDRLIDVHLGYIGTSIGVPMIAIAKHHRLGIENAA